MTAIQSIDTAEAEKAYSVANTPLFLLRKLRNDPAVLEVYRSIAPERIMKLLKIQLRKKPKSVRDAVLPSLLLNGDTSYLDQAAHLPARYSDWGDVPLHVENRKAGVAG